jgi:hypothetical protein
MPFRPSSGRKLSIFFTLKFNTVFRQIFSAKKVTRRRLPKHGQKWEELRSEISITWPLALVSKPPLMRTK